MKRALPLSRDLMSRAHALGVSTQHLEDPRYGAVDEPELQRRVLEAERHLRDSRLWWVAVLSSAAAVVSAFAAWAAVLSPK